MFIKPGVNNNLPFDNLDNLYVVADFDKTITNSNSKTSWSILENSAYIHSSYITERQALYDFYRPIELSDSLDYSCKFQEMKSWWKKHIDFDINNSTTVQEFIDDIVYDNNYLRPSYALNYKTPIEYKTQLGFNKNFLCLLFIDKFNFSSLCFYKSTMFPVFQERLISPDTRHLTVCIFLLFKSFSHICSETLLSIFQFTIIGTGFGIK